MTTVAVTSAGASPGASALAVSLGMARSRAGADGVVLVEADPAGGRLGPRFGLRADPSLATYVSDARRGSTTALLLRNAQRIGSLAVLASPVDPELTHQVLVRGGEDLARFLHHGSLDAVVDLGRLDDGSAALPFATHADQVLLVTRPRFDEVQALLFRRRLLIEAGCSVGLVTIGDQPHLPREVAGVVELPLMAALPDDAAAASAFCGGRFQEKRLNRTRLWKTVLALSDRLWPAPPSAPPAAWPGHGVVGAGAGSFDADAADPHAFDDDTPPAGGSPADVPRVDGPPVEAPAGDEPADQRPDHHTGDPARPPRRRSRPLSAHGRNPESSPRDA